MFVAVASRAVEHLVAGLLVGLEATDWVVVGAATGAMLMVATLAAHPPCASSRSRRSTDGDSERIVSR